MTDDTCGADTTGDHPCKNPTTDDGDPERCWIPSHNDPGADDPQGRPREAPSKATQEQIATVIDDGGSIREACRRAGVHVETFYRWMEYGEEQDAGPFQEFRERLVRARGEGEAKYRQTLMQIAEQTDDTATLMAMLKQRYPESWGDVNRGEQSGGVVVNVGDPDEYEVDPDTLEVVDE